jgi:hypothetical protein
MAERLSSLRDETARLRLQVEQARVFFEERRRVFQAHQQAAPPAGHPW